MSKRTYEITIEVQCKVCGSYVDADLDCETLKVEPCPECTDTAETRSYESGRQDGYDTGSKEAASDSYDAGYEDGNQDGYQERLTEEGE